MSSDGRSEGGGRFIFLVVIVIAATGLIGYISKSNDLRYLNKPVVERIDEIIFLNDSNIETSDLYRIKVKDGLIEIYHNSENYKAVYKVKDADSLEFQSPDGEIMVIRYIDYTKPESIEQIDIFNYAIKVFEGTTSLDDQIKLKLSGNNTAEIVLNNENMTNKLTSGVENDGAIGRAVLWSLIIIVGIIIGVVIVLIAVSNYRLKKERKKADDKWKSMF
ncbi:hypothetical protein [Acetobacterium wieringae]|jgi:hypothetical protein|uniref:Uncharacterized protein n=1 Tax=Acetobacterium wieringae TaxID=52694 RepID=A0A1F2PJL4_9FIRM|nr:hypothetical protein [Acetobacterium wieringae]OFV71523.1 hypothetical protein ACWI_10230 [Acetobacterium wieringae]